MSIGLDTKSEVLGDIWLKLRSRGSTENSNTKHILQSEPWRGITTITQ